MGTRVVAVLVFMLSTGAAQERKQQITSPMHLGAQISRYDLADPKGGTVQAADRLVRILGTLLLREPAVESGSVRFLNRAQNLLLVRGDADETALVGRVVEEVQKEQPTRARLQCSFVALPLSVAKEHGLQPGVVVATDETAIGRLSKDAAKHTKSVLNTPEVEARTLTPFAFEAKSKTATATPEAPRPPLTARGEMVPIGGGEVAITMQVTRDDKPAPKTTPKDPLLQVLFRLQAGKAALAMFVEDDIATVMIVRCTDVGVVPPTEPAPVPKKQ